MQEFQGLLPYRLYYQERKDEKKLSELIGDIHGNMAFFEKQIRIIFERTDPMKVLIFICKFADTCNRLEKG